ncbi:protein DELAY OF GERMINATION 1-like [Gossypium raimondii]|uniref:protein DELAY OF GERMINATION 1-like n=1 Tax=Gossypium raimondii TaxID=29730 RepID=UPI00227A438C|nr:protein DELAY OF GERMINATION 1-like [Gossypium raimondii]
MSQPAFSSVALTLNQSENDGNLTDNTCAQLVERSLDSFLQYIEKRVSGLFSPSWNTALENSLLWITGCRPSPYIRLTYAHCGSQVEYQLSEIIQGLAWGNLGQILATQLRMINNLHIKTIEEEEKLSSQLAGLQENIADQPIAMVAKRMSRVGESSGNVDHALDELESSMANILQEADKLRLSTLKELLAILTPLQGVDFLVASKKLHLCMHKWGKTRDNRQGRR